MGHRSTKVKQTQRLEEEEQIGIPEWLGAEGTAGGSHKPGFMQEHPKLGKKENVLSPHPSLPLMPHRWSPVSTEDCSLPPGLSAMECNGKVNMGRRRF